MSESEEVWKERIVLKGGAYVLHLKAQKIHPPPARFPSGYKVNCVLVDAFENKPILILDNHEPFGYHYHPDPIHDKSIRISLDEQIKDYIQAIAWFRRRAEEVINERTSD